MAVDITTIGIEMDTTSVKAGTADLNKAAIAGQKMADSLDKSADKVVKAGAKQEQAYKEVAREAAAAARKQEQEAERAARKIQEEAERAARSAQNQSRSVMQNLGWQTQDAIVQLQMGTSAATVFSQQGSQLASAWNPMLGLFVAVAGVVGGALYSSFSSASDISEELAEKIRELNKEYTTLGESQRKFLVDEEIKKQKQLREEAEKYRKEIEDLNAELSRRITRGTSGQMNGQSLDTEEVRNRIMQQNLELTQQITAAEGALETQNQLLAKSKEEVQRINGEQVEGDKVKLTTAQELIKSLEDEKAALNLSGEAMADYIAKKAEATGADHERIKSLYLEIEALQQKEEQEKKAQQEADRALRIEEQRAQSIEKMTAQMQREADLFGVTSREAQIVYDIKNGLIDVQGGLNGAEAQGLIIGARRIDQMNEQKAATDDYIGSLKSWVAEQNKLQEQLGNEIDSLNDRVSSFGGAWTQTGSVIADAFGGMSNALSDYAQRMEDLAALEADYADKKSKVTDKESIEYKKLMTTRKKLDDEQFKAQLSGYKNAANVFVTLTKEGTKERKVAHAVSMAISGAEMAMSLKETAVSVSAGAAKFFAQSGWAGFAGVAAMAAVMGGLGYSMSAGGGSGQSAQQIQETQGTGSVLGGGKSESISKAMDVYNDIGLEQLAELRLIREGLTGLSGGINKLSIGVITSGLTEAKYVNFADQYVGDIIDRGGLVTRGSRSQDVAGREMLAPLQGQISSIFGFIQESINAATGALEVAQNNPAWAFISDIGKVSFKDMTGQEIQSELNAIFSQQADLITEFVVPAMKEYQQMGEGLFETLTRVAAEMATFNYYTDAMGLAFNATGLSAIAVQQNIAELSGGMDKLTENMQTYYEEFFSEEERAANQMKLLSAEMKNLGYDIVPGSREGFRNLVEAIDLTTESGQKQFAGLMSLSEVFADLIPATESLVEAQRSAKDIAQERANLERQLLQLQGDTATMRAQDLSALDASNQALQQQIWALQDQAAATREAETAARALEQAQKAVANERYNLETQLLQAQGDTVMLRARELEKLDESNRAIQLQVWALEDLAAANNLAQQSANELAQKHTKVASERYGLETQLLQVQGKTDEIRARELMQLDESNRALQLQVWALEDQKAAAELAAQAQADASRAQEQALEDARRAAEEQRKLAQGVHDSISDALRSLMGESEEYNHLSMAQARNTLQSALGVAKAGGSLVGFAGLEDALAAVQKVDQSRFASAFEYNMARGQNIGLLSQLEKFTRVDGSHAGGLDYVPFDGYVAQLHKGERVMTASENKGQGELIAEIRALRNDLKAGDNATNGKLVSLLRIVEDWNGSGIPPERVA